LLLPKLLKLELPNLVLDESLKLVGSLSLDGVNLLLELEPKLLGRGLKLRLGVGVVVVVVAFLKLNLDLVLVRGVLAADVGAGRVVCGLLLLVNLALDLDLVRRGVALVVGSGTSEVACLLKLALCLEDNWAGLAFATRLGPIIGRIVIIA